jgi:iron complex transport system ATP-binding protein
MTFLKFDRVGIGYDKRSVLEEIDFSVNPGEIVAVVGPNGVGKSTLINAACGTLPLDKGSVCVDHEELGNMSAPQRARQISVVPQSTKLPSAFSVMDVVLMGRTPFLGWLERENAEDFKIADAAMRRTGTDQLADRLVGELSGGEQQRVLVARALAQASPVMLLDEPTSHLDLRHQDEVLKLVRELAKEKDLAILITLHDLNLVARYADRVVLLSNGKMHKIGLPEEVLTPEILAKVYGIQIHVFQHPIHGTPLVVSG